MVSRALQLLSRPANWAIISPTLARWELTKSLEPSRRLANPYVALDQSQKLQSTRFWVPFTISIDLVWVFFPPPHVTSMYRVYDCEAAPHWPAAR